MAARVFWYFSDDKFENFKQRSRLIDRLNLQVSAGIPIPGGPQAEVGISPPPDTKTLLEDVEQTERKLAKEGGVASLVDASAGRPPPLFEYEGPAARLVDLGVLWVAGLAGEVAFLLVGSASNVVGTPPQKEGTLSPTADPLGTIKEFASAAEPSDRSRSWAAWIWSTVVSTQDDLGGGLAGAPWVSGVAQYAGRTQFQLPEGTGGQSEAHQPSVLVIGSPLFVEQK